MMLHQKLKTRKKLKNYEFIGLLDKRYYSYTHSDVFLFKKKKSGSIWYTKAVKDIESTDDDSLSSPTPLFTNKKELQLEVSGQEFLRLYSPMHPKTRLIVEREGEEKTYYVSSKKVAVVNRNPNIFTKEIKDKVLQGIYTGLGQICVFAIFLNEYDFKFTNVVLLSNNQFIKLDGGWLYTDLQCKRPRNKITSKTIADLPAHSEYDAYNWIGYSCRNEPEINAKLDYSDFQNNIHVRREINEALLKILVTTSYTIKWMIYSDIRNLDLYRKMVNLLIERRAMMHKAALGSDSFLQYLATDAATNLVESFIKDVSNFNIMGKIKLHDSTNMQITAGQMRSKLKMVRDDAARIIAKKNKIHVHHSHKPKC